LANFTLTKPELFPDGTEVAAYPAKEQSLNGNGPVGTATSSGTIASGSVTFTDLTVEEPYFAYGLVGSEWRRVGFTPEANEVFGSGASQIIDVVADFLADRTGVLDCTDAINNAILALPQSGAVKGGEIYFPPGVYLCEGELDLENMYGVKFRSVGTTGSGYTRQGAVLRYTGEADYFINARSTYGFHIQNLGIEYDNVNFVGNLIDLQHGSGAFDTSWAVFEDCTMNGVDPATNTANSLISFKEAILCEVRGGSYSWAQSAFRFREDAGGGNIRYSNAHKLSGVTFANVENALLNAGEQLTVDTCWFEGTNQDGAGMVKAYADDIPIGEISYALAFRGCWFGDAVLITNWIDLGNTTVRGLNIEGCFFSGGSKALKLTKGALGLSITGNSFGTSSNPIDLGDYTVGRVSGGFIAGNDFSSSANAPVANRAGHMVTVVGNSARNGENYPEGIFYLAGHISTDRPKGLAPSIAAGAAAGTGPTVSVTGNDTAGTISVTPGSTPTTGTLCTVTYAEAFDTAAGSEVNPTPKVQLTPTNANAAALVATTYTTRTATTFKIEAGAAPTEAQVYTWDYLVIQ
jgi:hypothetical protein